MYIKWYETKTYKIIIESTTSGYNYYHNTVIINIIPIGIIDSHK